VHVRRVRGSTRGTRAGDDGVAVLLCASEGEDLARAALIEAEPALAAALVARAVRRAGPRVIAPGDAGDALAGAFAAIVAAAARRVPGNRAFRVMGAGPARALERELTSAGGETIEALLTVVVNDDAYAARVLIPRAAAFRAPAPQWTREALVALGETPLSLALVAAAGRSTAATIGSLGRGEAWLPGAWPLRRSTTGSLEGPVLLAAPSHELGLRAALGEDGRLVLREGTERLEWAPASQQEVGVSDKQQDALVAAVGEVPIVVRVEIGVAEMRAREWASLSPGDVVALGRKIGEAVTLRVGGVTVARGELVDLDGEVGVRILGRDGLSAAEPRTGPLQGEGEPIVAPSSKER
jgi:flagellar motor switch/type III secretory pathway protein FliN